MTAQSLPLSADVKPGARMTYVEATVTAAEAARLAEPPVTRMLVMRPDPPTQ